MEGLHVGQITSNSAHASIGSCPVGGSRFLSCRAGLRHRRNATANQPGRWLEPGGQQYRRAAKCEHGAGQRKASFYCLEMAGLEQQMVYLHAGARQGTCRLIQAAIC